MLQLGMNFVRYVNALKAALTHLLVVDVQYFEKIVSKMKLETVSDPSGGSMGSVRSNGKEPLDKSTAEERFTWRDISHSTKTVCM